MPRRPISDGRTQAASSSRPRTSDRANRRGAAPPSRMRGGIGMAAGNAGGGSSKNGREAITLTVPPAAHGDLSGGSEFAVRAGAKAAGGQGCR